MTAQVAQTRIPRAQWAPQDAFILVSQVDSIPVYLVAIPSTGGPLSLGPRFALIDPSGAHYYALVPRIGEASVLAGQYPLRLKALLEQHRYPVTIQPVQMQLQDEVVG